MMFGVVLSFVLLFVGCSVADPSRVLVTNNMTWANFAWGFSNGGEDHSNGMQAVLVDLDEHESIIPDLSANGHIVICYFSGATIEPWRPDCKANQEQWKDAAVGQMADWDEEWLDIRKLEQIKALMTPRFERAAAIGCHAVEPDNIDCYDNKDCWGAMTNPKVNRGSKVEQEQIDYNLWLASIGHENGLSVAMKNTMGLVPQLHSAFDFAINESCQKYSECEGYSHFTDANKAVFQVEYKGKRNACKNAARHKMNTKFCSAGTNNLCKKDALWVNCFYPDCPIPAAQFTS